MLRDQTTIPHDTRVVYTVVKYARVTQIYKPSSQKKLCTKIKT